MTLVAAPSGVSTLTDQEFALLAAIAAEEAGLSIPASKKTLVQSRIARRMREVGVKDCGAYLALLDGNAPERRELISVLTTNVSSFYRERHHFEFLVGTVVPVLRAKLARRERVRIWSAGCSSGQEPYTIAIELLKAIPEAARSDVLILASDIDPHILQRAIAGLYPEAELDTVAPEDRKRFFLRSDGPAPGWTAGEDLRRIVRFRELNLHHTWPMHGNFDLIMCRNVVIYFDETKQRALWPRFHERLVPGGWLMLGHSERIQSIEGTGFRTAGVTIYQKA